MSECLIVVAIGKVNVDDYSAINMRQRFFVPEEILSVTQVLLILLRFHTKTEQNLSVLALHSHCSAVKTALFEIANENP